MTECRLPVREFRRDSTLEPVLLSRDVARAWAVGTGRAREVNGDLQPTPAKSKVDTIGLSIIAVGNSVEPVADFAAAYTREAEARRGTAAFAQYVLEDMVEAANFEFGPPQELSVA